MDAKKIKNAKRGLCGLLVLVLLLAAQHAVADGQTLDLATGELTWTEGGALIETYSIGEGDTITVAPAAP